VNGDLRNPINQRGQSVYNSSYNSVYTIDGWSIGTYGNSSLTITPDGVLFETDTPKNTALGQLIVSPNRLKGITLTLGVTGESAGGYRCVVGYSAGATYVPAYGNIVVGSGTSIARINIPANVSIDALTVGISVIESSVLLTSAVLVEGTIAPPHTLTDETIELLRCQYYYRIVNDVILPRLFVPWENALWFYVSYAGMRVTPTAWLKGIADEDYVVTDNIGGTSIGGTEFSVISIPSVNAAHIVAKNPAFTSNQFTLWLKSPGGLVLDANL